MTFTMQVSRGIHLFASCVFSFSTLCAKLSTIQNCLRSEVTFHVR